MKAKSSKIVIARSHCRSNNASLRSPMATKQCPGLPIVPLDCFAEPVLGLARGETRGLAMTTAEIYFHSTLVIS